MLSGRKLERDKDWAAKEWRKIKHAGYRGLRCEWEPRRWKLNHIKWRGPWNEKRGFRGRTFQATELTVKSGIGRRWGARSG